MSIRVNLKTVLMQWFNLKQVDDSKRPVFVKDKLENSYTNGKWIVGD